MPKTTITKIRKSDSQEMKLVVKKLATRLRRLGPGRTIGERGDRTLFFDPERAIPLKQKLVEWYGEPFYEAKDIGFSSYWDDEVERFVRLKVGQNNCHVMIGYMGPEERTMNWARNGGG